MSFLLLEAVNLRKSFADRLILAIDVFRIYAGDRIGFVGANGSGKTTLLDILSGNTMPDEGSVRRYCDVAYIKQFEAPTDAATDFNSCSLYKSLNSCNSYDSNGTNYSNDSNDSCNSNNSYGSHLSSYHSNNPYNLHKYHIYGVADKTTRKNVSGGEAARLKIAQAMGESRRLVFADEPTSNLDMEGISLFGQELAQLESFVLVSHDRDLLNTYCNKIITLEEHTVEVYEGGFEAYRLQTALKKERAINEYEQYQAEKERLHKVYNEKKAKAAKVVKKPKGMSSSEIKQRDFIATSRSNDGRQRSFERAAKAVQARIDHLAVKEKPDEPQRMKLDFTLTEPPTNKIILSGRNVTLGYSGRTLFDNASFEIKNRARIALIGANGSGKTTLLNAIYRSDNNCEIGHERNRGDNRNDHSANNYHDSLDGNYADNHHGSPDGNYADNHHGSLDGNCADNHHGSLDGNCADNHHGNYDGSRLIYRVPKVRIGYFRQGFEQIDFQKSVLQNALCNSVQREATVRSVLARLLFTRNDVNKPAGVLSGGERIKLSFAMLLVAKNNVLLLDEPTNYLDMPSIEVLQAMLSEYEGTLLFVSHDRAFVNAICTELLMIENKKLFAFTGNLDDYAQARNSDTKDQDNLLLEHRLAALAGEIAHAGDAQKAALEANYMALLARREQKNEK